MISKLLSLLVTFTAFAAGNLPLPKLKVSPNRRFLIRDNGTPFLSGDTAWELIHRLNRQEVAEYLNVRAKQGFTVVQAVALAELDGVTDPNAYGKLPLIDRGPARPAVTRGANPRKAEEYDYWGSVALRIQLQASTLLHTEARVGPKLAGTWN